MSHSHAHRSLLMLLLGLMLLLTGCGSSASGSTAQATATTPATATPQAAATPQPTPTDFPAPPNANCALVAPGAFPFGVYKDTSGNWIEFKPNGQHYDNGAFLACYVVRQQHIEFFDKIICGDTATQYGDYIWAFDGTTLRFTLVNDGCSPRANGLANTTWTKVQGG